ncbi:MAG: formylglycine-generating enzyme family protein [Sandaracinaceae bacterium]|nr:formylglycine-generating enzyme family protein [Sandaracinaceae bacterium]
MSSAKRDLLTTLGRVPRSPRALAISALAIAVIAGAPARSVDADVRIEPASIVWIPEGAFTLGADRHDVDYAVQLCQDEHELTLVDACGPDRFANETWAERVYLSRFGLDRTEVSRAAYAQCVAAGLCGPSSIGDDDPELGQPSFPIAGITARDAERYCALHGGRLPSEAEWEKGARGTDDDRRFPWGLHYDGALANHGRPVLRPDASDGHRGLAPVGLLAGASPYGLRDMAGNVWEWTTSRLRPRDLGITARAEDHDARRVVRGGSYLHPAIALRVTSRSWLDERARRTDLGFRCAYDPP